MGCTKGASGRFDEKEEPVRPARNKRRGDTPKISFSPSFGVIVDDLAALDRAAVAPIIYENATAPIEPKAALPFDIEVQVLQPPPKQEKQVKGDAVIYQQVTPAKVSPRVIKVDDPADEALNDADRLAARLRRLRVDEVGEDTNPTDLADDAIEHEFEPISPETIMDNLCNRVAEIEVLDLPMPGAGVLSIALRAFSLWRKERRFRKALGGQPRKYNQKEPLTPAGALAPLSASVHQALASVVTTPEQGHSQLNQVFPVGLTTKFTPQETIDANGEFKTNTIVRVRRHERPYMPMNTQGVRGAIDLDAGLLYYLAAYAYGKPRTAVLRHELAERANRYINTNHSDWPEWRRFAAISGCVEFAMSPTEREYWGIDHLRYNIRALHYVSDAAKGEIGPPPYSWAHMLPNWAQRLFGLRVMLPK